MQLQAECWLEQEGLSQACSSPFFTQVTRVRKIRKTTGIRSHLPLTSLCLCKAGIATLVLGRLGSTWRHINSQSWGDAEERSFLSPWSHYHVIIHNFAAIMHLRYVLCCAVHTFHTMLNREPNFVVLGPLWLFDTPILF